MSTKKPPTSVPPPQKPEFSPELMELLAEVQTPENVVVKPSDRQIAVLKAQKVTDSAIAETLNIPLAYVEKVQSRPWFFDLLKAAAKIINGSSVDTILVGLEEQCVRFYATTLNDPNATYSVRKSCADAILSYSRGKPPQQTIKEYKEIRSLEDAERAKQELDAEKNRLMAELGKRGVSISFES